MLHGKVREALWDRIAEKSLSHMTPRPSVTIAVTFTALQAWLSVHFSILPVQPYRVSQFLAFSFEKVSVSVHEKSLFGPRPFYLWSVQFSVISSFQICVGVS